MIFFLQFSLQISHHHATPRPIVHPSRPTGSAKKLRNNWWKIATIKSYKLGNMNFARVIWRWYLIYCYMASKYFHPKISINFPDWQMALTTKTTTATKEQRGRAHTSVRWRRPRFAPRRNRLIYFMQFHTNNSLAGGEWRVLGCAEMVSPKRVRWGDAKQFMFLHSVVISGQSHVHTHTYTVT